MINNTKKKTSLILVLFVLLLSLSACGNNNSKEGSEKTEKEAEEKELSRGVWTENVFTSEFSGITFTMPEGWASGTDEEIAALMQVGIDNLTAAGTEVDAEALKAGIVYDMLARDTVSNGSVTISFEQVEEPSDGAEKTPEELYVEQLITQVLTFQPDVVFGEIGAASIGEHSYTRVDSSVSIDGIGITQTYLVRKIGNFIQTIVISYSSADVNADVIIGFFS